MQHQLQRFVHTAICLLGLFTLLLVLTGQPGMADSITTPGCGASADNPANNAVSGACTIFGQEFWSNEGYCDRGLKPSSDPLSALVGQGACVNDARNTKPENATWAQWALKQQLYNIGGDVPVNRLTFLGTHNSFSNYQDGDTNPITVNQFYSMTDQLNLGARSLRLDPHYYFGEMRLCHAHPIGSIDSNSFCGLFAAEQYAPLAVLLSPILPPALLLPPPIPEMLAATVVGVTVAGEGQISSNNRLFAYGIIEIADWLAKHPTQVIFLELNPDTAGHDDLVEQPIAAYLGSKVFTQAQYNTFTGAHGRWPTPNELLAMGKQVIIANDTDLGGWAVSTNQGADQYPVTDSTQATNTGFYNPNCKVTWKFNHATYTDTIATFFSQFPLGRVHTGDGRSESDYWSKFTIDTGVSGTVTPSFTGVLDEAEVSSSAQCGYSSVDLDFFMALGNAYSAFSRTGPDLRREAAIWSWRQDDYGVGQDGNEPAILNLSDGRWSTGDYLTKGLPYACASDQTLNHTWTILQANSQYNYFDGVIVCLQQGLIFSYPRTAPDNARLVQAMKNANVQQVRLAVGAGPLDPAVTDPTNTEAYMNQGGAPPDPANFEVDGQRSLYFFPQVSSNPVNAFSLLGNVNTYIPFSNGPVDLSMAMSPDIAAGLTPGQYGGTANITLFNSANSSSPYPYPSGSHQASFSLTTHVMVPSATTITAYPDSTIPGNYIVIAEVQPKCPPTGTEFTGVTGVINITDSSFFAGGQVQSRNLGSLVIQGDPSSTLNGALTPISCPTQAPPPGFFVCATVPLSSGRHQLAATYNRDATYNSSSSDVITVDVNGSVTPASLTFNVGLTPAASQALTYTGNKNPSGAVYDSSLLQVTGSQSPFLVTVVPNPNRLPGAYTTNISVNGGSLSSGINVPAVVNVIGSLSTGATPLTFQSTNQQAPAPQTITIAYEGGPLTARSDAAWLSAQVTPSTVTTRQGTTATVVISTNPAGLDNTSYSGHVIIAQPGNPNPISIPVRLNETINQTSLKILTHNPSLGFVCDRNTYIGDTTLLLAAGTPHICSAITSVQTPAQGQRATFDRWGDITDPVRTITLQNNEHRTYDIVYSIFDEVSVTPYPFCAATVSPVQAWVQPSGVVKIAYTPGQGETFVNFSGDYAGTNPNVTVTRPMHVIANFNCQGAACAPNFNVSPASVDFSQGPVQTVKVISSRGDKQIQFTLNSSLPPGITVISSKTTTPAALTVTADTTALPPGTYGGSFDLVPTDPTEATLTVPVTLAVVAVKVGTQSSAPIQVDSVSYPGSTTFSWIAGSTHTVSVPPTVTASLRQLRFNSWSDGGAISHSITAPALGSSASYTARFDTYYLVNTNANPTNAGKVVLTPISSGNWYLDGSSVSAQAVAASGFVFANFSKSLVGTTNPQSLTISGGSPTVIANFVSDNTFGSTTIDTVPSGLQIQVDSLSYTAPSVFHWGTDTHTVTVPDQAGAPGIRYTFSNWKDISTAPASRQITGAKGAQTYTATMGTQYLVTATSVPALAGTVQGAGWFNSGAGTTLIATPAAGFAFSGFSGDLTSAANNAALTVTRPEQVTVSFKATAQPTLYATAGSRSMPSLFQLYHVQMPLTLTNSGPGPAGDATITGIDGFKVMSGTGTVSLLGVTSQPATLFPGQSWASTVLLNWPDTATRAQFTVHFTANGGTYQGATTLTLFRSAGL